MTIHAEDVDYDEKLRKAFLYNAYISMTTSISSETQKI